MLAAAMVVALMAVMVGPAALAVSAKVNTSSARVYRTASTSSASVKMKKGTKVTVKSVSGGWAKVSLGGHTGYMPVKYLISAPWVRLCKPVTGPLYGIVKLMSKIAPSATIGSDVDEELLGNPESVQPYSTNPMVHNKISFLCAIEGFETGKALEDGTLEDNGKATDIPTMIMHGTDDGICNIEGTRKVYENLKRKGCNVQMIEWPEFLHEIHNGNKVSKGDEVIDSMIQFILG